MAGQGQFLLIPGIAIRVDASKDERLGVNIASLQWSEVCLERKPDCDALAPWRGRFSSAAHVLEYTLRGGKNGYIWEPPRIQ